VATNQLPLSPVVSTFALIIPEALGIHAANAAITLVREQRTVDAALAGQQTTFDLRTADLNERLAEVNEQREEERRQLKRALDEAAQARIAYEAKIQEIVTWHEQETDRLRAERAQVQDQKAAHTGWIDSLQTRHREEIQRLQAERDEDVEAAYVCGIIK